MIMKILHMSPGMCVCVFVFVFVFVCVCVLKKPWPCLSELLGYYLVVIISNLLPERCPLHFSKSLFHPLFLSLSLSISLIAPLLSCPILPLSLSLSISPSLSLPLSLTPEFVIFHLSLLPNLCPFSCLWFNSSSLVWPPGEGYRDRKRERAGGKR